MRTQIRYPVILHYKDGSITVGQEFSRDNGVTWEFVETEHWPSHPLLRVTLLTLLLVLVGSACLLLVLSIHP